MSVPANANFKRRCVEIAWCVFLDELGEDFVAREHVGFIALPQFPVSNALEEHWHT
jgi:hypothetical protein